MHLPLLLQSPGQPSVNTSCTCQTAEQVEKMEIRRTREVGGGGARARRGLVRVDEGAEGEQGNEKRQHLSGHTVCTPLTGLGMWVRV